LSGALIRVEEVVRKVPRVEVDAER